MSNTRVLGEMSSGGHFIPIIRVGGGEGTYCAV
jgi:hypothetical protein